MKSLLDELNPQTSVLQQAVALQTLVATVGFDWPSLQEVFAKLHEEIDELQTEIKANTDKHRMLDEFGDILFVCANIARWLDIDPEAAIAHANKKFEQRFRLMEKLLKENNTSLKQCNFTDMLAAWEQVKTLLSKTIA